MLDEDILEIKMNRKGFGLRAEIRDGVKNEYASSVIDEIKKQGFSKNFGRFTFHLAEQFGFCYGVDRAVEMAYETRKYFPQKKIFLTTEIIHNPTVNRNLRDMGVLFLSGGYKNADESEIHKDDVVIVPAFGATVAELKHLHEKGVTLVDTICGSVVNVWKRVERYASEGYTSIIHGKWAHEETQATSSRVTMFPGAHYLIVLSEEEAAFVSDYILNGGDSDEFKKRFVNAMSENFDPNLHLQRIGCANQTTMLSSESLHIAGMFRKALLKRFGEEQINERFLSFDTICSATQERQDAIISLKDKKPDVVLVVGGFNSSNTTHLQEIAMKYAASYHIDSVDCILDETAIRHQPFGKKDVVVTENWLPAGPVSIGITAGASTPNKVMGEVIEKILTFQNRIAAAQ